MRTLTVLVVLASAILMALAFRASDNAPDVSSDFTANITYIMAGLKYTGYMVWDYSGGRTFSYLKEFESYTYNFQLPNTATTYHYVITTSGCTCKKQSSTFVDDFFGPLRAANQNGTCNSSGTAWTTPFLGLPGTSQRVYCLNGNTPTSVQDGPNEYIFTNFVAGRPSYFPLEPMQSNQSVCEGECI